QTLASVRDRTQPSTSTTSPRRKSARAASARRIGRPPRAACKRSASRASSAARSASVGSARRYRAPTSLASAPTRAIRRASVACSAAAAGFGKSAAGVLVHPRAAHMMPLPADSLDPLVRVAVEVEAHAPEPGLAERKRDALLHRGDGPALELAEAKLYLGLT